MRNWEALGQSEKAAKSRKSFIACIVYFCAVEIAPFLLQESRALEALSKIGAIGLLIGWYYAIGKSQQAYVAARFGTTYPRRSWAKPLLAALGVFVGLILVTFVLALAIGGGTNSA